MGLIVTRFIYKNWLWIANWQFSVVIKNSHGGSVRNKGLGIYSDCEDASSPELLFTSFQMQPIA